MNVCRSCDSPVIWVETEATLATAGKKGKPARKMPLDADPANLAKARKAPYTFELTGEVISVGNILFTGARSGDGTWIVRYVKKGPNLFVSHFATCPNGPAHRKSR